MTVANLMELVECREDLLAHLSNFNLKLGRLRGLPTLHVEEPALVEVDAAVTHHKFGSFLFGTEGEAHDFGEATRALLVFVELDH